MYQPWADWLNHWVKQLWSRYAVAASFGYSANVWRGASAAVYNLIGDPRELLTCPPLDADALPIEGLAPSRLSYFNLHGIEDGPEWYGQRSATDPSSLPEYPVALRPADVTNSGRAPSFVFSEACYGANILNKHTEDALCLKFLDSGTRAMVASTKIAYGSVATPLIGADLLGKCFWQNINLGLPAGEALQRAKLQMAQEMQQRQGFLDGEDQKTLIEFVLYGDPLATAPAAPKAAQRAAKPLPILRRGPPLVTVCEKAGSHGHAGRAAHDPELTPAVIAEIKGAVSRYLPGMQDSHMVVTLPHRLHGRRPRLPHRPTRQTAQVARTGQWDDGRDPVQDHPVNRSSAPALRPRHPGRPGRHHQDGGFPLALERLGMTTHGFHYFPDELHYRRADLQAWLPEMLALDAKWITLIGSMTRAVPEAFVRGLLDAGIEPIIHLPAVPTRPDPQHVAGATLSQLFTSYARWGVRFVSAFAEPNMRAAWAPKDWGQAGLVNRFLDLLVPVLKAQVEAGLQPVFPPLRAGGDYWDTAFLDASLTGLMQRGLEDLARELSFSVNLWTYNRPIDWGKGGHSRWPDARPYLTPPGTQDQRGFHLFEWYDEIIQARLGELRPFVTLAGGPRIGDQTDPTLPPTDDLRHASCIQDITSTLHQGQLPQHLLNVNYWLLAAGDGSPFAAEAWYRPGRHHPDRRAGAQASARPRPAAGTAPDEREQGLGPGAGGEQAGRWDRQAVSPLRAPAGV